MITRMDEIVGMRLKELEKEGVADNTIVFFYSDHGGQISRTKRFIYNGGTQVPFIVYLPEKWKHLAKTKAGETYDNLVSFVDFPKTLLSIAGCKIPEIMQGHIFLGKDREESPKYVHLYRDRMDEQPGFARAVTDGKYHFIRNFMPHCPEGRLLYYPYDVQANWGAWKNYFELGKCNETQSRFFQTNPVLKFFDVEKDKWEVENLANKPEFQKKVKKMSDELDRWMIQNRDLGLVPEAMFFELIGKNKKYKTLYEYAQSSDYEIERILGVAKAASFGDQSKVSEYLQYMNDDNPIVRYWGAYGVFLAKEKGNTALEALKHMVQNDDIAANRLMAAQGLGLSGDRDFACWAILKELEATNDASIFHAGLMALLFSHTDVMLGEKDWQKLRSHAFPNNIGIDQTVAYYSMQIINGILQTWPDEIRVD